MKSTKSDSAALMCVRSRPGDQIFKLTALALIAGAVLILAILAVRLVIDGSERLSFTFLSSYPSRFAERAGVLAALTGSVYLIALTAVIALPLGVAAALYLEEYARKGWFSSLIEVTLANLAGVPSIIFGLLGLQLFVRWAGLDRSLLAGALTMSLLLLPTIVVAAREALRTVPKTLREASFALGATKWQTISWHVLPLAMPGILTGCILGLSRAIGETAPLITIGALTYVAFLPESVLSPFTALPIQSFNWLSRPQQAFHANAAAAIVVLLVVLLVMNSLAIFMRSKLQKRMA